MRDQDCMFCKIIAWEVPSVKIREDDDFIAILDAFPNRKWMTMVISKDHYDSDIFNLNDDILSKYIKATKKVTEILKKWLNVDRIWMVAEWLDVQHAHIKLYPFYNWMWFQTWVWSGPQENIENLQKVAKEIQNNQ